VIGDDELGRQLIDAAEQFPVRGWSRDLHRRVVRRRRITAGFAAAIGVAAAAAVAVAVPMVTGSSPGPNSTVGPTSIAGHQSTRTTVTGSSPRPSSTVGPTSIAGHQSVRNLAVSSALRAELTAIFVAYKQISPSDIAGTVPGSVYYAYDPATDTYWAEVTFAPSATAPQRVLVGFQDGGSVGFYTKVGSGPWRVQTGGAPPRCTEELFFPRAVLTAWSLPTDTAGC